MKASVYKIGTPRRLLVHHGNERRLVTEYPRRRILRLAAGAAALPAVSRIAWAQAYPTRPVRIIVGYAAGGSSDIAARLIGQALSDRFGQQFIVENRPGAGGNIGTEAVVRAPPDGYTLLLAGTSCAVNETLYQKLNFNFVRDIAPVAPIARVPSVLTVNPFVPVKTVFEFIDYAKANPGKLNFASGGNGSGSHMSGEMFKLMTGVDMPHVPYRGEAPALTDLLGGQVQVMFPTLLVSLEHIRANKLRILAVTTAMRLEALPNVPALGEFVPKYEAGTWVGIGAPRNAPAEIVDKLNRQINVALADPKTKAQLADLGATVLPGSPGDFGKLIAEDTEKWANVIRAANMKAE
jgi:tripartite-type tricarboxylate transporter receptor subunit TctC